MDYLMNQCRSANSYPINPNVQTEFILKQIYDEIVKKFPNPEVNTRPYVEKFNTQYRVIFFRFQALVPYKNTTYNVFSELTFPPNFPAVPPIFSVINSDDNRFQVNKHFFNFLLPDGTYEVKLMAAATWTPNFVSFLTMYAEFGTILSTHFPFFATANPLKNPNLPFVYDSRYNDVTIPKPFDLPNQGSANNFGTFPSNQPGSFYQPGYARPISPGPSPTGYYTNAQPFNPQMGYGQLPYNQPVSNPYVQVNPPTGQFSETIPNTSGYNSQNVSYQQPGDRPAPTPQSFKDALYKIKADLDTDSKTVFEHVDFLLRKKDELSDLETKLKASKVSLGEQISRAKKQEEELQAAVEKSKSAKKDRIENYLEFRQPKDEVTLKLLADLQGNQETEIFLEDAFMEAANADLDTFLLKMNSIWRKQFDKSLALKVL